MTSDRRLFIIVVLLYLWRLLVLGTCAYAVFWLGHSGWWFVPAVLLLGSDEGFFS